MTAFGKHQVRRLACLIASGLFCATFATFPARADGGSDDNRIVVVMDQARLVKLPERVSTVVVGNPLIADVSIQAGGLMVVTGKGYGVTNIVALDRAGMPLLERNVTVKGAYESTVVVYRGMERETYNCVPFCEPRVTLGDGAQYFSRNLSQTGSWLSQIQGAAQMSVK